MSERRIFFELAEGADRLFPIYVQFLYHTNDVRGIDYNSNSSGLQFSSEYAGVSRPGRSLPQIYSMEEYPMYNPELTTLLQDSNVLPRGTVAIRLLYPNNRTSYMLDVSDGDVIYVKSDGVIQWDRTNRSWLSGRDFTRGIKTGVVCGRSRTTCDGTPPIRYSDDNYDADGGLNMPPLPKKSGYDVCVPGKCSNSGCVQIHGGLLQRGGTAVGKL